MEGLYKIKKAQSRSISAENKDGRKNGGGLATEGTGKSAGEYLGVGWKISPSIDIKSGETVEIADINGPGKIVSMWMTAEAILRYTILRIYWDDQEHPSVEVPLGDFFGCASGQFKQVNALPISVNPTLGFNCYFEMPFNKKCRITIENLDDKKMVLFYQINYELISLEEPVGYFHAQFNRVNPVPYKAVYPILEGVEGEGHYVGTYLYWQSNNNYWWGEGEIKFYMDDDEAPTICGTGTEDYFGGAWSFRSKDYTYLEYSTPYLGFSIDKPDLDSNCDLANTRFNLYRYHIQDPIRFTKNLNITIQALGWRSDFKRYLPLQEDISSVAMWYQTLPSKPFKPLPCRDELEII